MRDEGDVVSSAKGLKLIIMLLGKYGSSQKFAWVDDKYGVLRQLNWA